QSNNRTQSFESFSEDPILSGLIASAYVRGTQNGGIGVAIKHFVGNDKENDRMAYDSVISPRALREIYLMPFMLTEKNAKPWSMMTAYNRVNGTHVSENPYILNDILRKEWGFKGLVMSDWFGVYSVDTSLKAGLDLEMPGVNKWRTLDLVNRSIQSRKLTTRDIRSRARKVLELVQKCARGAPE
ncbi:putative beta-glucosidase I, partial [Termitomyces sp. T112]